MTRPTVTRSRRTRRPSCTPPVRSCVPSLAVTTHQSPHTSQASILKSGSWSTHAQQQVHDRALGGVSIGRELQQPATSQLQSGRSQAPRTAALVPPRSSTSGSGRAASQCSPTDSSGALAVQTCIRTAPMGCYSLSDGNRRRAALSSNTEPKSTDEHADQGSEHALRGPRVQIRLTHGASSVGEGPPRSRRRAPDACQRRAAAHYPKQESCNRIQSAWGVASRTTRQWGVCAYSAPMILVRLEDEKVALFKRVSLHSAVRLEGAECAARKV